MKNKCFIIFLLFSFCLLFNKVFAADLATRSLSIRRGRDLKTPTNEATICPTVKVRVLVTKDGKKVFNTGWKNISNNPISVSVNPTDKVKIEAKGFNYFSGSSCNFYKASQGFKMPNMNVRYRVDRISYGIGLVRE